MPTRTALAVTLLSATAALAQPTRPPNIIFILADDQGYNDLSCYGSPLIKTPRIDQMAKEGMRFTDFYAPAAVCTPTRAALLTGCYPQRVSMSHIPPFPGQPNHVGHVIYPNSPAGLNPDEHLIPEILKTKGYTTAIVGKWHLGDAKPFLPVAQGFDSYFGIPYSNDMKPTVYLRDDKPAGEEVDQATITQRYTEESLKFIRAHAKDKDKPFFLYLAHNAPHTPLVANPKFKGKSARGLYGDLVEALDDSTGQILDALKELNIDHDTMVIYTSDNGPWHIRGENGGNATPLRAGKGTTYEGGFRVPCVVRYPALVPAGTVCHEPAVMFDWLPTFAALAGATVPTDRKIDGKDITQLLKADPAADSPHDAIYYYANAQLNAVRSGPWKLKLPTTLKEETEYGKIDNPDTVIGMKLYNLTTDPGEQKDVLKDHPNIQKKLESLAQNAREELGDARTHTKGSATRPLGLLPGTPLPSSH